MLALDGDCAFVDVGWAVGHAGSRRRLPQSLPCSAMGCILGIESSCDETAAAVVDGDLRVRASVVASQHELHREYGGVVPEIASRAHLERIVSVIERALSEAGVSLGEIDGIAAGVRPGLIGSLLVGASAAKGLAWARGVPFHAIDHVAAHLFAGLLRGRDDEPAGGTDAPLPALGLVVSGGHTSLFRVASAIECTKRSTRRRRCSGFRIPADRISSASRRRATRTRCAFRFRSFRTRSISRSPA
jgi:hypothetical protein